MTEAREGGQVVTLPGKPDERHHKDRVMERDTERRGEEEGRREEGELVNYSPCSAVVVLWEGVMRAEGRFKRLEPNWATELRIRRSGQI